jgi:hypothetical protein
MFGKIPDPLRIALYRERSGDLCRFQRACTRSRVPLRKRGVSQRNGPDRSFAVLGIKAFYAPRKTKVALELTKDLHLVLSIFMKKISEYIQYDDEH